jgi:tRNA (mo5U34)-methyltransferase
LAEAGKLFWAHSIDLGRGIVTPGHWGDHTPIFRQAMRDIDFRGEKVLDIGCWDGLWSFEAEKRGAAEVYATDYLAPRNRTELATFSLAYRALGSRAKYFPQVSVYDVERLGVDDFDLVIDAGIFYHLRDPLRSRCCVGS